MRVIPVFFVLALSVMGTASADPVLFHPGTGVPNPGQGDSRAMWSEPPDLNGMLLSSELITSFGLETEVANDFVPTEPTITRVTLWGGYYNNETPCNAGIPTPGFNFRFYEDNGCVPPWWPPLVDLSITQFTEEAIGCQEDSRPLFKWGADVAVTLVPGVRYWFGAQLKDHAFPPQGGRLASMGIVDCEAVFANRCWDCWDWTPIHEVTGFYADFSQEFGGDHSEACCFPDGHCEFVLTGACAAHGGVSQGPGSVCDPNPCQPTPAHKASWGAVRALFR